VSSDCPISVTNRNRVCGCRGCRMRVENLRCEMRWLFVAYPIQAFGIKVIKGRFLSQYHVPIKEMTVSMSKPLF
jgi:hypothetical protein